MLNSDTYTQIMISCEIERKARNDGSENYDVMLTPSHADDMHHGNVNEWRMGNNHAPRLHFRLLK